MLAKYFVSGFIIFFGVFASENLGTVQNHKTADDLATLMNEINCIFQSRFKPSEAKLIQRAFDYVTSVQVKLNQPLNSETGKNEIIQEKDLNQLKALENEKAQLIRKTLEKHENIQNPDDSKMIENMADNYSEQIFTRVRNSIVGETVNAGLNEIRTNLESQIDEKLRFDDSHADDGMKAKEQLIKQLDKVIVRQISSQEEVNLFNMELDKHLTFRDPVSHRITTVGEIFSNRRPDSKKEAKYTSLLDKIRKINNAFKSAE